MSVRVFSEQEHRTLDVAFTPKDGKVEITAYGRKGMQWMKENQISYRNYIPGRGHVPGDWNPIYTPAEAEAIRLKADADGIVVG